MSLHNNETEYRKPDDWNIRIHLDRALDKENINVSEKLIKKTLTSIQNNTAARKRKNIFSTGYVRKLTSVAAVVLIVLTGYGVFKNSPMIGTKKSSIGNLKDFAFKTAKEEDTQVGALDSKTSSYTCSDPGNLVFKDICQSKPETSVCVKITDVKEHSMVSIADQAGIEKFFTIMNKFLLQKGSSTSQKKYYTVKIKGVYKADTVCHIGDTMVVQSTSKDAIQESNYALLNYGDVKGNLEELYQEYSK